MSRTKDAVIAAMNVDHKAVMIDTVTLCIDFLEKAGEDRAVAGLRLLREKIEVA